MVCRENSISHICTVWSATLNLQSDQLPVYQSDCKAHGMAGRHSYRLLFDLSTLHHACTLDGGSIHTKPIFPEPCVQHGALVK